MKNFFIKIIAFVKKNIFACACFLLATMVFLTGSVSYSRYISTSFVDTLPSAGSFTCSASIDGVSSLSFTNTSFWGGSIAEDKVAMNALRTIDFTVNNYRVVNDKKVVNEVKTNYSLVFTAPYSFVQRLAFQPFHGEDQPFLPQIVVSDIFHSYDVGSTFHTGYSEDYHAVHFCEDMEFIVEKDGYNYTATTYDTLGNLRAQIKLEYIQKETHQNLLFRMWDCSRLTDEENKVAEEEGGTLLPPLEVFFRRTIPFYQITVSMPTELQMPAGVETSRKHSIRLTPTHTIHDDHLGGMFVNVDQYGVYHPIEEIYGQNILNNWTIETNQENHYGKYYYDENFETPILDNYGEHWTVSHDYNLMNSPKIYNQGEIIKGEPVSFTEVKEHVDGNWQMPTEVVETLMPTTDGTYGLNKTNYSDQNSWYITDQTTTPPYRMIIANTKKTVTTTYTPIERGTITRDVTESEDTYVLGEPEGFEDPTRNKAYLRVTYSDKVHSYVSGEVTKTVTTTYTSDLTFQVREGWWGSNYQDVSYEDFSDYGFSDDIARELLFKRTGESYINSQVSTTENVSIDLGETEEVRYMLREVTRTSNHTKVTIENIRWPEIDEDGLAKTDENGNIIYNEYHIDSPLKLFDENGVQKLYLAPCYSKNYPFYVDVIFEQIQ